MKTQDLSHYNEEFCNTILDGRLADVSVYHHPSIAKLQGNAIASSRIASPLERSRRMQRFGFTFDAYEKLLDALELRTAFERMDVRLPQGFDQFLMYEEDGDNVSRFFNLLNGSAGINYEALFPDADFEMHTLKFYRLHVPEKASGRNSPREGEGSDNPSTLPVTDIFYAETLRRLTSTHDLPASAKIGILKCVGRILDIHVDNDRRLEDYLTLSAFADNRRRSVTLGGLQKAIRIANEALLADHPRFAQRHQVVDLVIPLHGGDCSGAAYMARAEIAAGRARFLLPLGGHAPHQIKELGVGKSEYSEMDEILATALVKEFRHRMPTRGCQQLPTEYIVPLSSEQIVPTWDRDSDDTSANAKVAASFVQQMHKEQGRPIRLLIVTCAQHAYRARAQFLKLEEHVGQGNVTVEILPLTNVGVFNDLEYGGKPEALGNLFCEYTKRLYDTCVA